MKRPHAGQPAPVAPAAARADLVPKGSAPTALAVFVLLLTLYACTMCRTIGPGDSGEFVVAMARWGVPHAPGYPLLGLLGNLATALLGRSQAAVAANLINALFAAAAAGVVVLAVATATRRVGAGFLAGLALGTGAGFWSQALSVEVVSLNALFAALLLLALARIAAIGPGGHVSFTDRALLVIGLASALTHHATIVFVGLPVLIACGPRLLREDALGRRSGAAGPLAQAGVVALVAALPLLYLPLAARHDPVLNWGDPRTLGALLHGLLRRDFGMGGLVAPYVTANEILRHGASADPFGARPLLEFLSHLPRDVGWSLSLLALVGALGAMRRAPIVVGFAAMFALGQIAFFSRVNTPFSAPWLAATERFHVMPEVVIVFLGGVGLGLLLDRVATRGAWTRALAASLVVAELLVTRVPTAAALDQRQVTFTRDLGANFLAGLPEGALAFTDGDLFRNGSRFVQSVEGARPDVALVDPSLMAAPWYVAQLRRRHTLHLPDSMQVYTGRAGADMRACLDAEFTAGGSAARAIVAVRLLDASWRPAYRLVPMGLWSEIRPRGGAVDLAGWARRFSAVVAAWELRSLRASYASGGWEASQLVFYRYALGNLAAVRAMTAAFVPGAVPPPPVPGLALAARWRGAERADFLAYQADAWWSALADSLLPVDAGSRALATDRARQLAEASLREDATNLQALQTLAAVRGAAGDPAGEVAIRERIVGIMPGDAAELSAYLGAVGRALETDPARRQELAAQADAVRRRAIDVIGRAERQSPNPDLARFRAQLAGLALR